MQAEAEQYSYDILKNWMILRLNILINNILIKKSYRVKELADYYRTPRDKKLNAPTRKEGLGLKILASPC